MPKPTSRRPPPAPEALTRPGVSDYALQPCAQCGALLAVRGEERLSPIRGMPHRCRITEPEKETTV